LEFSEAFISRLPRESECDTLTYAVNEALRIGEIAAPLDL
jgi:hypothetical protein